MPDEPSLKSLDYGLEYRGGPKDGEPLEGFGYPYGTTVWLSSEGYYRMELRQTGDGQRLGAFWHMEPII